MPEAEVGRALRAALADIPSAPSSAAWPVPFAEAGRIIMASGYRLHIYITCKLEQASVHRHANALTHSMSGFASDSDSDSLCFSLQVQYVSGSEC